MAGSPRTPTYSSLDLLAEICRNREDDKLKALDPPRPVALPTPSEISRARSFKPRRLDIETTRQLHTLLDTVLEVEPWSMRRHSGKKGIAWRTCGETAFGGTGKHAGSVGDRAKMRVFGMARHYHDDQKLVPWKSDPGLVRKVAAIVDKLSSDPQVGAKFARKRRRECEGFEET